MVRNVRSVLGGVDTAKGKRVPRGNISTLHFLLHPTLSELLLAFKIAWSCISRIVLVPFFSYVTFEIDESKTDEVLRLLRETD